MSVFNQTLCSTPETDTTWSVRYTSSLKKEDAQRCPGLGWEDSQAGKARLRAR